MKSAKIESSQFSKTALTYYDEVNNQLYITFANESIYRYDNVPDSVFELLQTVPSAGKYFNSIRTAYEFKRVTEVPLVTPTLIIEDESAINIPDTKEVLVVIGTNKSKNISSEELAEDKQD